MARAGQLGAVFLVSGAVGNLVDRFYVGGAARRIGEFMCFSCDFHVIFIVPYDFRNSFSSSVASVYQKRTGTDSCLTCILRSVKDLQGSFPRMKTGRQIRQIRQMRQEDARSLI